MVRQAAHGHIKCIQCAVLSAASLLVALLLSFGASAEEMTLGQLLDRYRTTGIRFIYSPRIVDEQTTVDAADQMSQASLNKALAGVGLIAEEIEKRVWGLSRRTGPGLAPEALTVYVRDRSGNPVTDAVLLVGDTRGHTSPQGIGTLALAARGTLTVIHPDYTDARLVLRGTGPVTVTLEDLPDIANIVVSASRYELHGNADSSTHHLTGANLSQTPAFAEDSLRIVHRLPGAASIGVSSRPRIRGGLENEVLVLFDGVELVEPFHLRDFQALFSAFNPRTINSIEYYTGGFPARYGNSLSGVLDIATQDAFTSPGGEIGLSTFNTSGLYQFSTGRHDWLVSARRGNLDLVLDKVNPAFGQPHYHDVLGRYGTWIGDGRLELSVFRFHDDATLRQDEGSASSTIDNNYVWGAWEREGEQLYLRTTLSFGSVRSRRAGETDDPPRIVGHLSDNRNLELLHLKQELEWQGDAFTLFGGFDYRDQRLSYATVLTSERGAIAAILGQPSTLARVDSASLVGRSSDLHATLRFKVGERVTLQPGLRIDYQNVSNTRSRSQLSPRLSVLYDATPALQLRFSFGDFHQPQAVYEIAPVDGESALLNVQRARHWITGLTFAPGDRYRFVVEAFHKQMRRTNRRHVNLFNPHMLIPELEPDRVAVEANRAVASGIELSVTRLRGEGIWSWTGNYTSGRTRDRVDARWIPRRFDQQHTVNLISTWEGGRWTFSVAGAWHSGWALTKLPGVLPFDDPPATTLRNNSRLRSFGSLDARLAFEQPVGRGSLTAFVEVTNVVNRTNDGGVDYEVEVEDGNFVLAEVDLEPIFPLVTSAGIVWRF